MDEVFSGMTLLLPTFLAWRQNKGILFPYACSAKWATQSQKHLNAFLIAMVMTFWPKRLLNTKKSWIWCLSLPLNMGSTLDLRWQ
ncbi:hypothetical protein AT959_06785 [Dechloromonas denitrificans]|uniref:Uncharacterized protein n=1 Tax=Dechloromonas denitrificans TaxID=281362 RepID=A0A133XKB0_9RHOO|nr:hypothetical protein AT959_06785 [Dechloromonas denitrificans]